MDVAVNTSRSVIRHGSRGPKLHRLTEPIRLDIERHARIGGGISRSHALILLNHIDRLGDLLDEVMCNGQDWTEREWSYWSDVARKMLDE